MKLLQLSLLIVFFICKGFAYNPTVGYVSFLSSWVPKPTKINLTHFNLVQQEDDSPFQMYQMPFTFPFFGKGIDKIFLSPNGEIHTSPVLPCGAFFCGDFNSTFLGIIAAVITDLDPSSSLNSSITAGFTATTGCVEITYANIPYWSAQNGITNVRKNTTSFRVHLYSDGRTDLIYDKFNTSLLSCQGLPACWLSGIRNFPNNTQFSVVTAQQMAVGKTQWSTSVPGVYPMRSDVKPGSMFTACPISTAWCAQPAFLNITNGPIEIILSAISVSCLSALDFAVSMSPSPNLQPGSTDVVICSPKLASGQY